MYSQRFKREIVVTKHAVLRMRERAVTEAMVAEIIDSGETKYADETHLWAYKFFPDRSDNFLCAVLVLESCVVVKTVMHKFEVLP